jgi:HrpA-like RNA helicase
MMDETVPELQRTCLTNTVLYLKAIGLHDVLGFDFLDPPSQDQLREALILLHVLGAIDNIGNITSIGKDMICLPLEPSVARIVVEAAKCGYMDVFDDALTVAAMLSIESLWIERPIFSTKDRDSDNNSKLQYLTSYLHYSCLISVCCIQRRNVLRKLKLRTIV